MVDSMVCGLSTIAMNWIRVKGYSEYNGYNYIYCTEAICNTCGTGRPIAKTRSAMPYFTIGYGLHCFYKGKIQWSDIPMLTMCGFIDKAIFGKLMCLNDQSRCTHDVQDVRTTSQLCLVGLGLMNLYCLWKWFHQESKKNDMCPIYETPIYETPSANHAPNHLSLPIATPSQKVSKWDRIEQHYQEMHITATEGNANYHDKNPDEIANLAKEALTDISAYRLMKSKMKKWKAQDVKS